MLIYNVNYRRGGKVAENNADPPPDQLPVSSAVLLNHGIPARDYCSLSLVQLHTAWLVCQVQMSGKIEKRKEISVTNHKRTEYNIRSNR